MQQGSKKLSSHQFRSRPGRVSLSAGIAAGGGGGRREVLGAEAAGRLLPPLELLLPLHPLHVQVEQEVVGLVVLRARRVGVALLEIGRRLLMLLVVVMMLLLLMMLSKPKLQEDYIKVKVNHAYYG